MTSTTIQLPNNSPAFEPLPVPTGLQADNDCQSFLNDNLSPHTLTETSTATMTQVPATTTAIMKATIKLVECFLHPTKTAIRTATYAQSFLLFCIKDAPAIMMTTATHAWNLLLPSVQNDSAITTASSLQLIVESLFLLCNEDNSETMAPSILLFCIKDAPAIMMTPLTNFSLQLIVVIFCKISFHFCEDCRIFCEGEYQVNDNGYAINKHQLPLSTFSLISAFDHNLAFGLIMAFSLVGINGLVKHIDRVATTSALPGISETLALKALSVTMASVISFATLDAMASSVTWSSATLA
jgi:hypothetical protein